MPQPLRTKNHAQLAEALQISQFKSNTLQTMGYSLSTPSIFFYLYGHILTVNQTGICCFPIVYTFIAK